MQLEQAERRSSAEILPSFFIRLARRSSLTRPVVNASFAILSDFHVRFRTFFTPELFRLILSNSSNVSRSSFPLFVAVLCLYSEERTQDGVATPRGTFKLWKCSGKGQDNLSIERLGYPFTFIDTKITKLTVG